MKKNSKEVKIPTINIYNALFAKIQQSGLFSCKN